jgi:hypothetical protein
MSLLQRKAYQTHKVAVIGSTKLYVVGNLIPFATSLLSKTTDPIVTQLLETIKIGKEKV